MSNPEIEIIEYWTLRVCRWYMPIFLCVCVFHRRRRMACFSRPCRQVWIGLERYSNLSFIPLARSRYWQATLSILKFTYQIQLRFCRFRIKQLNNLESKEKVRMSRIENNTNEFLLSDFCRKQPQQIYACFSDAGTSLVFRDVLIYIHIYIYIHIFKYTYIYI